MLYPPILRRIKKSLLVVAPYVVASRLVTDLVSLAVGLLAVPLTLSKLAILRWRRGAPPATAARSTPSSAAACRRLLLALVAPAESTDLAHEVRKAVNGAHEPTRLGLGRSAAGATAAAASNSNSATTLVSQHLRKWVVRVQVRLRLRRVRRLRRRLRRHLRRRLRLRMRARSNE